MSVSQPGPLQPTPTGIVLPPERIIWEGSPSQVMNFWTYVVCFLLSFLVIPIFIAIWEFIRLRSTVYEITTQRIRIRRGIFSRSVDEVELYRVRDYHLEQPFLLRMFGVWNIVINTVDKSSPRIVLEGIRQGETLRDDIRNSVEAVRLAKGVREVDLST